MKVPYLQVALVSLMLFLSVNGNNTGYIYRPVSYMFYEFKKGMINIFCSNKLLYSLKSTNILDGYEEPMGSENCVRLFLNKLGLRELK
jgi:hypothetical protein